MQRAKWYRTPNGQSATQSKTTGSQTRKFNNLTRSDIRDNRRAARRKTLGFLQEERVIQKSRQESPGEWTDPVDAVILPVGGRQGGTESAGGIEGAACERTGDHDAQHDADADGETGYGAERGGAFVDGGGKDRENEEESRDAFENHAVETREVVREHGGAESDGVPSFLWDDRFEEKCGGCGSGELRGPVGYRVESVQALGDPEADGDGGIEMAAGDMAEGANHDGHGKAVRQGDAEEAEGV